MAVTFKDSTGADIEPGDTVKIVTEVVVQTVVGSERGSQLTYADGQHGGKTVLCSEVEKIASRP